MLLLVDDEPHCQPARALTDDDGLDEFPSAFDRLR
jgi:hypothetical protein